MASIPHISDWLTKAYSTMSFNLAGLVILADFNIAAIRTALTGTSSFLDSFVLVPGLHKQSSAPELSKGEYPACAAMTTGYVFRVENPATVYYLQSVGRTGHLTTLSVTTSSGSVADGLTELSTYPGCVGITLVSLWWLFFLDLWAFAAVALLVLVRFINAVIMKRRAVPGWFGAAEPGVQSDLMVLLSQDRWIRIKGATDDVKAVTSGTWLRELTPLESIFEAVSTLFVYFAIMLVSNAAKTGQVAFLSLILASSTLLSLANYGTRDFRMHGRRLRIMAGPTKYNRRLTLAKELIKEFGRTDCFVGMGMIQPHQAEQSKKSYEGAVVM